ncbi:MAG: hypothetical protein HOQ06_09795, partial [Pseudarthrobacter sp.]|nr:hypothetical protein [Pseudarthrobacter sp.]
MTAALPAGADSAGTKAQDPAARSASTARIRQPWFRRHRGLAAAGAVVAAALALAVGTQLAPKGNRVP